MNVVRNELKPKLEERYIAMDSFMAALATLAGR